MPDSHSEGERGKSGTTIGRNYYLPREVFTSSGQPDRKGGNLWTKGVKESAAGIIPVNNRREGPNLLTKGSFEDA